MPIFCCAGKPEALTIRNISERKKKVHHKQKDLLVEKGYESGLHHGLVHKATTVKESMNIPEAKADEKKMGQA